MQRIFETTVPIACKKWLYIIRIRVIVQWLAIVFQFLLLDTNYMQLLLESVLFEKWARAILTPGKIQKNRLCLYVCCYLKNGLARYLRWANHPGRRAKFKKNGFCLSIILFLQTTLLHRWVNHFCVGRRREQRGSDFKIFLFRWTTVSFAERNCD